MTKKTILITGAGGQIGSVLTKTLRDTYGANSVIATDIRSTELGDGPFELLDVLNGNRLHELVNRYRVTEIYHLAAILSARGEQNPKIAWDINMDSLFNVLDAAKERNLKVFFPSSIAAFGPNTPKVNTPQDTITQPTTVYGISKAAGENWCQYYFLKYGLDVRSVRFPGIIGYQSLPGGGTTDYAVDIYHKAILGEDFTCFLGPDTRLPMLYMDDAIQGVLQLMSAPKDKLSIRTSYNLAGVSFTPAEISAEIQKHHPDFKIHYAPDFRQAIADSWPQSIDDQQARQDWNWQPQFDLARMTADMLSHLQEQYLVGVEKG
ncbi:NAD-dependent epimerase/dehydratase family protein [Haliscomenobacter sp.]|uniref:NAD-dependent epimerase/dehydratase family protein n=1 Tax=Haliscomenobacter sp. TaxID=2717303 RepID=UPI003BAD76F6